MIPVSPNTLDFIGFLSLEPSFFHFYQFLVATGLASRAIEFGRRPCTMSTITDSSALTYSPSAEPETPPLKDAASKLFNEAVELIHPDFHYAFTTSPEEAFTSARKI